MAYILSAPSKSGYTGEFDTLDAVRAKAAELLGSVRIDSDGITIVQMSPEDVIEVKSGDGGTTYCYASQEDADADQDGAYAVNYTETALDTYDFYGIDRYDRMGVHPSGRMSEGEQFATYAEVEARARELLDIWTDQGGIRIHERETSRDDDSYIYREENVNA